MKFQIIKKPSGSDLKAINEFVSENWDDNNSEPETRESFRGLPDMIIVAYLRDKIVGLLGIQIRNIIFNDQNVSIGGIGNVVTHLNHRGEGIATKILTESISVMKKDKLDIAFVTNLNPKRTLYKRAGFVDLGRPYQYSSESGGKKREETGMIAPAYSQEVFDQILSSPEVLDVGYGNI